MLAAQQEFVRTPIRLDWRNKYQSLGKIPGETGFVNVYRVRDIQQQKRIVKEEKLAGNRAVRTEVNVLSRLSGEPGFPQLYEYGVKDVGQKSYEWLCESELEGEKLTEESVAQLPEVEKLQILRSYVNRVRSAWGKNVALWDHKVDNFLWDKDKKEVGVFDLNTVRFIPPSENYSTPPIIKALEAVTQTLTDLKPPFTQQEIEHVLRAHRALIKYGARYDDPSAMSLGYQTFEKTRREKHYEQYIAEAKTELGALLGLSHPTAPELNTLLESHQLSLEKQIIAKTLLQLVDSTAFKNYDRKQNLSARAEAITNLMQSLWNYPGIPEGSQKVMDHFQAVLAERTDSELTSFARLLDNTIQTMKNDRIEIPTSLSSLRIELNTWSHGSSGERQRTFSQVKQKITAAVIASQHWDERLQKEFVNPADKVKVVDLCNFVGEIINPVCGNYPSAVFDFEQVKTVDIKGLSTAVSEDTNFTLLGNWIEIDLADVIKRTKTPDEALTRLGNYLDVMITSRS